MCVRDGSCDRIRIMMRLQEVVSVGGGREREVGGERRVDCYVAV